MNPLKKIVVIGPESTGKSSLCEQLSSHFKMRWCPEYAREYLLKYGMNYEYENLLTIAKGQIELEENHVSLSLQDPQNNQPLLFIDTDMYVMKVWCEFVFNKCHQYILDQIAGRQYDLYLLCNTDLPWVADELREYPDLETRERLFYIYKDILVNQNTPWVEIKGNYDKRLNMAITATKRLFKPH
ncbi:MAG: ATPase [Bacteroidetes bacterium]|nr:MAG: ATPase [Bacteroidota bacterium]